MSIFGSIVSKIFHHGGEAPAAQTASVDTPAAAPAAGPQDNVAATPTPAAATPAPSAPAVTPASGTAPTAPAAAAGTVDVSQVLEGLAAKNPQKLDWRHSIVDMMKLLDLDSSFTARKELAKELAYTGDMNDSASMNIWLHSQVMKKLAENGGKVPDDLKA